MGVPRNNLKQTEDTKTQYPVAADGLARPEDATHCVAGMCCRRGSDGVEHMLFED